mmetsp:Transcript_55681/g.154112  ORF Transcript_55681/g.154112 Transcript_55681/m.154112 type:complete len:358 (-) Transcript_55681:225-1298(-)
MGCLLLLQLLLKFLRGQRLLLALAPRVPKALPRVRELGRGLLASGVGRHQEVPLAGEVLARGLEVLLGLGEPLAKNVQLTALVLRRLALVLNLQLQLREFRAVARHRLGELVASPGLCLRHHFGLALQLLLHPLRELLCGSQRLIALGLGCPQGCLGVSKLGGHLLAIRPQRCQKLALPHELGSSGIQVLLGFRKPPPCYIQLTTLAVQHCRLTLHALPQHLNLGVVAQLRNLHFVVGLSPRLGCYLRLLPELLLHCQLQTLCGECLFLAPELHCLQASLAVVQFIRASLGAGEGLPKELPLGPKVLSHSFKVILCGRQPLSKALQLFILVLRSRHGQVLLLRLQLLQFSSVARQNL